MEAVCRAEPPPSTTCRPWDNQGPQKAALPAYLHIAGAIGDRLASGTYGVGTRLPSESQFCAEFGVSHMTVRKALSVLADRGLISTTKGRGTFARAFDIGDSVFSLRQLMDECARGRIEVRLLSASIMTTNNRVASMIGVPAGDPVVYLRRLVLSDDTPAIYHREYVPSDPSRPLVDLLVESASLHGLLSPAAEAVSARGEITLRAAALGRGAARILDEPVGAPALCIEHVFQDVGRRPVCWGRYLLRAGLFRLQSVLGPDQPVREIHNQLHRRYQK